MMREFEGKTEQEAIANAIAALGLDENEFDIEVMKPAKKGLFKKGPVKIRVHVENDFQDALSFSRLGEEKEKKVISFLEEIIQRMSLQGEVKVFDKTEEKIIFNIQSPDVNFLIGKHGKTLDALQVLANVYTVKLLNDQQKGTFKVILDSENYRNRWEDRLVRLALKTAQQVRKTKISRLLEPMNPFERRLIHVTLNDMTDITTKSEGDGLIKQVRISHVDHY